MLDSKRIKVLLANVCCLILIITFLYHRTKYEVVDVNSVKNEENLGLKSKQNDALSQKYQRKLCELDRPSVESLMTYNTTVKKIFNSKTLEEKVNDFFHEFIQNPHRSYCKVMKRFGGEYNSECKFTDGSKFVCMDELLKDIENGECLIYSFGVANDWSFEDTMDELGCKVYAFDGSVDFPEKRGKNIHFEKVMVGFNDTEEQNNPIQTKTLPRLINKYGHTNTKISYLKMDIEGNERQGLRIWLHEGALDNVQQIGLEFHLDDDIVRTNHFIRTLKYLYLKGNYRLISYEANGCAKNTGTNRNLYFNLAEIVLKKKTDSDICY